MLILSARCSLFIWALSWPAFIIGRAWGINIVPLQLDVGVKFKVLSRVQAEDRFSSQSRSLRTKHCDFVLLVTTVLQPQNFELLMCLMFKQRLLVTLRFARDVTFCDAAARNANGGQEMVFDRRRRLISSHYADVLRWELARVLIESPRLLLTKRKNAGS